MAERETTAKQVAMVWACAAKRRNVWSMKRRVPGQETKENVEKDSGKRLSCT